MQLSGRVQRLEGRRQGTGCPVCRDTAPVVVREAGAAPTAPCPQCGRRPQEFILRDPADEDDDGGAG